MTVTTSYKDALLKARNLRGKAGENAWQRAKLLVSVFEDDDFRADVGAADDWKAAEMLDAEIEDLCLTFLQLREMLKAFPQKSDWKDGRLRTLYERTVEARPTASEEEERPVRTVNRVTKKEFEQERQARKEVEARYKYVESEVDRLRRENEELRGENQRLLGRIQELERLLKREQVAA